MGFDKFPKPPAFKPPTPQPPRINPASGLPMTGGAFDIGGNAYGFKNNWPRKPSFPAKPK
jgi:hypothetical protein